MDRLRWVLAGLLLGVTLVVALPAGAHHGSDTRKLLRLHNIQRRQIANLRSNLNAMGFDVETLQRRTQRLNDNGGYFGLIGEQQVQSISCEDGDDAMWIQSSETSNRFLGCTVGPYAP